MEALNCRTAQCRQRRWKSNATSMRTLTESSIRFRPVITVVWCGFSRIEQVLHSTATASDSFYDEW